jgi:hypothetical protein
VQLKGHEEKTVIVITKNRELAIDPVRHLTELRDRIRQGSG